jgi:cytochrome c oxidase subunit I+III
MFIFPTFKLWWPAAISAVLALGAILVWLWTGTAAIPEKKEKNVGLRLTLPLYVSGSSSVGWWAMFIMMLGDMTAFVSIVFGYFFYWTIHKDLPSEASQAPGVLWPALAALFLVMAWVLTVLARQWNKRDRPVAFYIGLFAAASLALSGTAALIAGPWFSGLDPAKHVYPAIVWLLVIWTAIHAGIGLIMQLYCVARRVAGRMTAEFDIDIANVVLYWHFVGVTVLITVAVIAGFPLLA